MNAMRAAATQLAIAIGMAAPIHAQGVGVPPPHDHGFPNLATIQLETALAFDQPHSGSSALRLRYDTDRFAIGGSVGAAFGGSRSLLLAITPQLKLISMCDMCTRRLHVGVFADGARTGAGDARLLTAAAGVGAAGELDFTGFGITISGSFRGGAHDNGPLFDAERYFGAALGAALGMPLLFDLFANIDYMSVAPRSDPLPSHDAFTFGFGIRVRAGEGT